MTIFPPLGLLVIYEISHMYPFFINRKFYHALCFLILIPGVQMSLRDNLSVTVFYVNIVTVFLILLEVYRYIGCASPAVVTYFRNISSGRERQRDALITSHIWLFMGAAFPI